MKSQQNYHDIIFEGDILSIRIIYIHCTWRNQILELWVHQPAEESILTCFLRCKKTQQLVLHSHAQEDALQIPTLYNDSDHWADYIDSFIQIV